MDNETDDHNPFLSPLNLAPARTRIAQKRTASFAQLEDSDLHSVDARTHGAKDKLESSSRIHIKSLAFASNMEKASFERKILTLESERKGLEVKLTMKDREIARLENDKRWLAEREAEERSEKESLRKETENERKEASIALSSLRSQLAAQMEEHAQLQQDFSTLKRSTSQTINEQKVHLLDLTRQAGQFEEEIKQLKEALEERDEAVTMLRSELDAKDASSTFDLPLQTSAENDTQGWKVIQDELHRQTSYIQKIDIENLRLKAEVVTLKDRHESIQVLREEKRQLESRLKNIDDLRHRVVELESENDRLRGQLPSLSEQHFTDSLSGDLESLRFKNMHLEDSLGMARVESITLNNKLTECQLELGAAQERVNILEVNLAEVKAEAVKLKRKVDMTEGEIRFWKSAAELDKRPDTAEPENMPGIPSQAKQLIENLQQERELLLDEISRLGGGVERHGRSWLDLSKSLNEEMRKRAQAEEDLSALQDQYSTLMDRIESLEQTLFELRGDIASGSHVPPNHRVLCLKENPLQQWIDIREEAVNRLKKENEALLSRLAALTPAQNENDSSMEITNVPSAVPTTVPRESWEVEHAERLALEEALKQKDKRLLRLQQIFQSKAQEFKDAISSILGFKFHFNANGQVRLTSQYDLNTSFIFQPSPTDAAKQDGQVNMQLVGAGDSSLEDLSRTVSFWVERRNSIPGLMATVTLECFDKVWMSRREGAGDGAY